MVCTLPIHMLHYIAHTFLPQYSICNVTLSDEHIMFHCVRYRQPLSAYCRSHGLSLTQTTLLGDELPDVVDIVREPVGGRVAGKRKNFCLL